jgi:hypothetical protein
MNSVKTLAGFLVPDCVFTEQQVFEVAASTEFNTMKESIRKNPGSFHFNPDRFFRSGKTEDWKEQLSEAAIAAINAKTAKKWGTMDAPLVTNEGQDPAFGFTNLAA